VEDEKSSFYPLPDFLKKFFFILTKNNLTEQNLDDYCIDIFLYKLPAYKEIILNAKKNVSNLLGPLQSFKFYFESPETYNLKDFTIAYKIFFENLKKFPNKDISLRRIEPFGLNPFELTSKFLTTKDVPFPEAVDYYTYYKAIYKQQLLLFLNNLKKDNSFYFKIKISNLIFIFRILKNNFIFSLIFKKKILKKKFFLKSF
jgi:hypothetical protein